MNSEREGSFSALASDSDYCDWTTSQTNTAGQGDMKTYDKARYCTPNHSVTKSDTSGLSAVDNGHMSSTFHDVTTWGYSDDEIITDAATYENGYFARASENIVPGQWVRKFTYVKNTDGSDNYDGSDAYIFIRYMVPTEYAGDLDLKIPGTPYEADVDSESGLQPYFYAVELNTAPSATTKYKAYELQPDSHNNLVVDGYTGYTEAIGGTEYKIYAAVTRQPIESGEMTFWSPVNTIRLKTDRQNTNSTAANYVAPGAIKSVVVDAQAIQAKTFSDAIDAINHLQ